MVELIGALKVESALDARSYQKGIRISNAEMKCLDPEWNYTSGRGSRQNRSSYCSEYP
jgi:hypothetical protein